MKKENKKGLLWLCVVIVSILLDQLTKQLAVTHLKPIETFPIIEDVLHLTYVTNYGAAFGILADHRWVFLVISTVAIALLSCYLYFKRDDHPLLCTALSFIIGGGAGNMIDRTILGYVVDFVDFRLINFAVFNVADMFVCVGCAMMFLWLFRYAEFEDEKPKKPVTAPDTVPDATETETETETGDTDDASDRS
ncbi:MAG: signal peptidase II [Clostridia bacterium]|nr:signal peptidase II [Clostridia bacterium]